MQTALKYRATNIYALQSPTVFASAVLQDEGAFRLCTMFTARFSRPRLTTPRGVALLFDMLQQPRHAKCIATAVARAQA